MTTTLVRRILAACAVFGFAAAAFAPAVYHDMHPVHTATYHDMHHVNLAVYHDMGARPAVYHDM